MNELPAQALTPQLWFQELGSPSYPAQQSHCTCLLTEGRQAAQVIPNKALCFSDSF